MGKRSTSTTKSGKFMNPTDQARKEARKRELKKNKKQRQMVRTAVLKGKNPQEIVAELEKLDDMEFNVLTPPALNDKVMKDKRRKLHETWQRVIRMYEKDDLDQYNQLRKLWHSYQNRKQEMMTHYESVKNAENVQIDEIPLPSGPNDGSGSTDSIPLPPTAFQPKASILKKPSALESLKPKTCPGVPFAPPPALSDYIDANDEGKEESGPRAKRIRFNDEGGDKDEEDEDGEATPQVDDIQKKMLAMAGQDVDQYMKEMEEVHRQTQAEKAADLQKRLSRLDDPAGGPVAAPPGPGLVMPGGVAGAPLMPPRPHLLFRPAPPPLRPGMAPASVRLPPGPPPGRPAAPPGPPPGRPPMIAGMRMPPGPPPGMPGGPRPGVRPLVRPTGGVLSAGPQISKDGAPVPASKSQAGLSVIEAKPQMRNLRSDITRFVPTNVKVKRDNPSKKKHADPLTEVFRHPGAPQPQHQQNHASKDDDYAKFMQEMEQLM